jgi:C4-type Zn-finger protein
MSVDTATPNPRPHDAPADKRRRKRPSIRAMIKEAKAAGLEITAIECDESGIKIVCASHAEASSADDADNMDQRMTEQMGVARLGGRARR